MTVFATTSPNRSGIGTQEIWDLTAADFGKPWTVKELLTAIEFDLTEFNIKNVSNRCGYLVQQGHAQRIAQGTYVLIEKGKPMTYTDTTYPTEPAEPGFIVPAASVNPMQCPECKFVARSEMGLKAHMTRSHTVGKLNADEVFERIGTACEVLWPDGVPMSRVMEIAELQKQMAKALTRK